MASVNNFNNNLELVKFLRSKGHITTDLVFNTMSSIDRKNFTTFPDKAYNDEPHIISHGKTISSPHMHAISLELIVEKLKEGGRALDIGSGSGYLTTCMAKIVGSEGNVIGMDCIPEFRDMAKKIVKEKYPDLDEHIDFVVGDGKNGYPTKAPYDIIVVGAAVEQVPQVLIDQLAPDGRLLIPVGTNSDNQFLLQVDKPFRGIIKTKRICQIIYELLSDVKECEMFFPDMKKNISSLTATMQKMEEKLSTIDTKICHDCEVKRDETSKVYKKIDDLQKILKDEIEKLKIKVDNLR